MILYKLYIYIHIYILNIEIQINQIQIINLIMIDRQIDMNIKMKNRLVIV